MASDTIANIIPHYHVVFLHEKLEKTREDRYIVDLMESLRKYQHAVTILTSYFNPLDCLPELHVSAKRN